ncbi:MAG: DUF3108 domain-containing protein [Bacteroidales bacterium]
MKLFKPATFLFAAMAAALLALPPGSKQALAGGKGMRTLTNAVFDRGERLQFTVYYNSRLTGNVRAGEAILEIQPTRISVSGRPTMHVVGQVYSKGIFNLFFKVDNRYDTYIDDSAIAPLWFSRDIQEGSYRRNEQVTFDHLGQTAVSARSTTRIVPYTQDILSALYYGRTLDVSKATPGDAFAIDYFFGDSVYVSQIVFEGREQITTQLGTFNTLRFKPMVLKGQVFGQTYPMTLWFTDDRNKILVQMESALNVGNMRMELSDFKGLKHPLQSKIN